MKIVTFQKRLNVLIDKFQGLIDKMPYKGDTSETSQKVALQIALNDLSYTINAIEEEDLTSEIICPECKKKVRLVTDTDTDWYGNLKYYFCRYCRETFVSQNNDKLEIAAL